MLNSSEQPSFRLNLAFGLVCFAAFFPILTGAGGWIPAHLSLPMRILCGVFITQGALFLASVLPFLPIGKIRSIFFRQLGVTSLNREEIIRILKRSIPLFLIVTAFSSLMSVLAKLAGTKEPSQELVQLLLQAPWSVFFAIAIPAVFIAPVVEELAFRRILFSWFKLRLPPISAITATSLLFAAIHNTFWQIPPLFLLAYLFQTEYIRSGEKTTYPMLQHACYNAMTVLCALAVRLYQTIF